MSRSFFLTSRREKWRNNNVKFPPNHQKQIRLTITARRDDFQKLGMTFSGPSFLLSWAESAIAVFPAASKNTGHLMPFLCSGIYCLCGRFLLIKHIVNCVQSSLFPRECTSCTFGLEDSIAIIFLHLAQAKMLRVYLSSSSDIPYTLQGDSRQAIITEGRDNIYFSMSCSVGVEWWPRNTKRVAL